MPDLTRLVSACKARLGLGALLMLPFAATAAAAPTLPAVPPTGSAGAIGRAPSAPPSVAGATSGHTARHDVLIGFHYGDLMNHEGRMTKDWPLNVWPMWDDYTHFLEDELQLSSYADFWRWWYVLERYKGDEKGLIELDRLVDECLARGIKVKIDIAWNTWWTQDKDWEIGAKLPLGPQDVDDWIHLCDLLGRRYRGRMAVWDLQGEANSLEHYWDNAKIEHVQEIYRTGYLTFKQIDPQVIVGASGASPSVPREKMDEWYKGNIDALVGHYDNIPINFFADVADPYKGGLEFYNSIQQFLNDAGTSSTEIGMGETSVQWAETTQKAGSDGLTIEKQAVRLNELYGGLFDAGMTKFISWWTEFAPGGGHWPWRWGYRNFEDLWGLWPEDFKVPGTQIVYRYRPSEAELKKDDKLKEVDLRPNWPNPADMYYPAWEIYRFWAQAAPAASESLRLPMEARGPQGTVWPLAVYQRSLDRVVALIYNDQAGPLTLEIEGAGSGWAPGMALRARGVNEAIDFKTGAHNQRWQGRNLEVKSEGGRLTLILPESLGFTAVAVQPAAEAPRAELEGVVIAEESPVGRPVEAFVVLRNRGRQAWPEGARVALYRDPATTASAGAAPAVGEPQSASNASWPVAGAPEPGDSTAVRLELPAAQAPGREHWRVRLQDAQGNWFGPVFGLATRAVDRRAPRKLVAFGEVGQVRVKWFAPEWRRRQALSYELQRATGFDQEFKPLTTIPGTEYVDTDVEPGKAYYYRVVARDSEGNLSNPAGVDNAKALANRRIMHAQIVAHTIPELARQGEPTTVSVTVRNTGTKAWDLTKPDKLRYWLQPTQLWGFNNEEQLPRLEITGTQLVEPGQDVTFTFPYVGRKPGRWENHFVMRMEVPDEEQKSGWDGPVQHAYFGTPLLVETLVPEKGSYLD